MINWRNDPASIVRAQVDKWFGTTSLGPAFITRDGGVFRVSKEELTRMRAEGEHDVLILQTRMTNRAHIAIGVVVATLVVTTTFSKELIAPWGTIIKALGYAIYSCHGIWMFYEAYRYDREVKAVRDTIGGRFEGKVPLPAGLTGSMLKANPFQLLLTALVLMLVGLVSGAELLAHRDIDLITLIPDWAYLGIVPFAWGLYFLAHIFDRSRGVGS
jgi:hypothetical protein